MSRALLVRPPHGTQHTGDVAPVLGSWATMLNNSALPRLDGFVSFAESNAPDNGTDDARGAIATADARARRLFANYGTYRVNSNITIASPLFMDYGAILKPASGITITINGDFDGTLTQHFDLSLGGTIAFGGKVEALFPQWWGVVGDSATNDASAFQAAIYAAQDARAQLVIPDPGGGNVYRVNSSIKVTKSLYMRGTRLNVTIQGFGLAAGVPVLDVDGDVNPNLENVRVESLQLMTDDSAGDCMHVTRVAGSFFEKIRLRDAANGIVYDGARTYSNSFRDITCVTVMGTNGLLASPHGGGHYFDNCSFGGTQGVNWRGHASRTADTVIFHNCNFESCVDFGALVQPLTLLRVIVFDGCRFEGGLGSFSLSVDPDGVELYGLTVRDCYFATVGEDWAIQIGDGSVIGYSITDNVFEGYDTAAIRWNGSGSHGVVHSNVCPDCALTDAFRDATNAVFNNYSSGTAGPTLGLVPAAGPFRQPYDGWYQDNVTASQTAVVLARKTGASAFATKAIFPRAGSVTAVWVKSNAARSAGTLTVEVYKNTSAIGLTAVLNGTDTTFKTTTQARGVDTFVAGDELDIRITTDGSWAPTTADIETGLEVET